MKNVLFVLLFIIVHTSVKSQSKLDYLKSNSFDMHREYAFPQSDFNVIGFGAFHGSQKTEIAENLLLRSVLKENDIDFYIMETDFSLGHYFNEFLTTGDTVLLKDLVMYYGILVPQEQAIQTYDKWKALFTLNQSLAEDKRIKVLGTDLLITYKYSFKQILELIPDQGQYESLKQMKNQLRQDTTDFSPFYDSYSKSLAKQFVEEISTHELLDESFELNHIVENMKLSFGKNSRGETIFNNYISLYQEYQLQEKKQFVRYGFDHLGKEREFNYPSFFTRLIEENIYERDKVITVLGYLTKSEVLWNHKYDGDGNHSGYTTEAGYGISDYWREYFRGIKKLKKTKRSDLTLYRLNKKESPYHKPEPDLIDIRMIFSESNSKLVKGRATTRFIDYAILISNSEANRPIQELK